MTYYTEEKQGVHDKPEPRSQGTGGKMPRGPKKSAMGSGQRKPAKMLKRRGR